MVVDKREIAPIIIGKLLNIGGMLEKKANTLLKPYNLNQQQYSILFAIHQQGKVNQKSMVNKLLLEKPHVSKLTKKLHTMGLIDVEASEEDKRSSWLSVTAKGRETVRKCQETIHKWNLQWTDEMGQDELEMALESLTVLQEVFRATTDQP
jgi:DNA-binding MarR family transcriptional regulator